MTQAWAQGACPSGYQSYTSGAVTLCRPQASSDFYYGALSSSLPQDRYPICGPGRIPTRGDGSYPWMRFASSGVPKSAHSWSDGAQTYQFLKTASSSPEYAYQDLDRCACIGKTITESGVTGSDEALSPINGGPRLLPDTFDVIADQSTERPRAYGMVAIADDHASDGRRGILFAAGKSKCGCPNFNEVAVSVDPLSAPSDPVGVRCVPAIAQAQGRVLARFDPKLHDAGAASQVLNRASEPVLAGSVQLVQQIQLPRALNQQNALQSYSRRIWTCARPYQLDSSTSSCAIDTSIHGCDAGDPARGVPPSEVHPSITGSSKLAAFENTQNKKLAACLNEFGSTLATIKFDCVDNQRIYADMNELWAGADSEAQGGQPYGFQLTDGMGKVLTGFYTLEGKRCEEFSEFAGALQPGRLRESSGGWVFAAQGNALPQPSDALTGVAQLKQRLAGLGKRVPATATEMKQCPLLVRAALVANCPKNGPLPAVQKTLEVLDASGSVLSRRCSIASTVTVHTRIEQLYEIEGSAPIPTQDSVADRVAMSGISVAQINFGKKLSACPPGTSQQGELCVY